MWGLDEDELDLMGFSDDAVDMFWGVVVMIKLALPVGVGGIMRRREGRMRR